MRDRLTEPAVRVRDEWRGMPNSWDDIAVGGRTLPDLAADAGIDPPEVALDLVAEHGNGVQMVAGGRSERDLADALTHPAGVIGSDGQALDPDGPTGRGTLHPRSFGCYPPAVRRVRPDGPDRDRRSRPEMHVRRRAGRPRGSRCTARWGRRRHRRVRPRPHRRPSHVHSTAAVPGGHLRSHRRWPDRGREQHTQRRSPRRNPSYPLKANGSPWRGTLVLFLAVPELRWDVPSAVLLAAVSLTSALIDIGARPSGVRSEVFAGLVIAGFIGALISHERMARQLQGALR